MLEFIVAAALWQRRRQGGVARVDFSMIEAMLWTMADPLLAAQCGEPPVPMGSRSAGSAPQGTYRCAGEDDWIAIAVGSEAQWQGLRTIVPDLPPTAGLPERLARQDDIDAVLARWLQSQSAAEVAAHLVRAGVPAARLADALDLVASDHLRERGFWEPHGAGVLPGLPWRASFGRRSGEAPGLGADTNAVLAEVIGATQGEIDALRRSGSLG